MKTHTFWT